MGTYTVTLTVTNASGCIAQIVQQIIVCSGDVQTGNIIGPVNVNESDTVSYSVTFHPGSTYNWTIIGGNQTSGGTTNFISVKWGPAVSGQIIVVETDSIGCKGNPVSMTINIGPTGTFDNEIAWQVNVYPNPNTGKFMIELNIPESRYVEINLYNLIGEVIYNETLTNFIGSYQKEIDLQKYAKGIYNLKVIFDRGVVNRKVVLE